MKFLLEKGEPYYDTERDASRLDPATDKAAIKQTADLMKQQKKDIQSGSTSVAGSTLAQARKYYEGESNLSYDKLRYGDRDKFVRNCLGYMKNYNGLKSAEDSISKHIVDDDWKNNDFITFIEKIPQGSEVDNDTVNLVYDLQSSKKN